MDTIVVGLLAAIVGLLAALLNRDPVARIKTQQEILDGLDSDSPPAKQMREAMEVSISKHHGRLTNQRGLVMNVAIVLGALTLVVVAVRVAVVEADGEVYSVAGLGAGVALVTATYGVGRLLRRF